MSQSMVTVYKFVGSKAVRRYGSGAWDATNPKELFDHLEAEVPGSEVLYKTKHYDPTSIAIIDVLRNYFPLFTESTQVRRYKDEDIDILTLTISAKELPEVVQTMNRPECNVEEVSLFYYLVDAAIRFWSELLAENGIDSVVVICCEKLAPSLLSDDVVKAARG